MKDEELEKIAKESNLSEKRRTLIDSIFDIIPETGRDWIIVLSIIALIIIWIADLFIPDPLPFVDEILLPIITYLVAQWYSNRKKKDTE